MAFAALSADPPGPNSAVSSEFMKMLGIDAQITSMQRRRSSVALRVDEVMSDETSPQNSPVK